VFYSFKRGICLSKWQGKVSINTTNVVIQSFNTEAEFYFPTAICFRSSWDHHQAIIMIERLKLFELPNTDPNLVQHIHIQSEY
jgi:hypothetical protein